MRVIAASTLQAFWAKHPTSRAPLGEWLRDVRAANWAGMSDIKQRYPHASVIDAERVVFNIGGNKYRLLVKLYFPARTLWIKFVGTHESYDAIDVTKL